MNLALGGALLALALVTTQSSVAPGAKTARVETPHLAIEVSSSAASVAGGERLSLFVDVAPKAKMHVYSPEQKAYLPISLRLDPNPALAVRAALFPKGQTFFFAPTGETQIVYSRPFRIDQPITVRRDRAAGPLVVTGTLFYQACDDTVCYVPRTVPMKWTLMVR